MTKYDCSSADLNPIGGINKTDIKSFLDYYGTKKGIKVYKEIATAAPTAELRPFDSLETQQKDEDEMGMTYEELRVFGELRMYQRTGPVSMYEALRLKWSHLAPKVVAEKVKRFFFYYGINRHKMTVLTPSYHAEGYSNDDNRFDLRPFLYGNWERQFAKIDKLVERDT